MISRARRQKTDLGEQQGSFTAWNGVLFAAVLNDHSHRTRFDDSPPTRPRPLQLIARKRALFADDKRLIGNWEVTPTEDGINLHAEARGPHSLLRDLP
jgi:hypothetical protein